MLRSAFHPDDKPNPLSAGNWVQRWWLQFGHGPAKAEVSVILYVIYSVQEYLRQPNQLGMFVPPLQRLLHCGIQNCRYGHINTLALCDKGVELTVFFFMRIKPWHYFFRHAVAVQGQRKCKGGEKM